MRAVQTGPVIGLLAQLTLLAALAGTVGLTVVGLVVGVACGVTTSAALSRALRRRGAVGLGPADRVTLVRATIAGGVAGLVADSFSRPTPVAVLVALAVVALVLDAVDGWLARRTGTASPLGARFDTEVDAFLILVLSMYAAGLAGAWVVTIGAARYALVAAGLFVPWLRESLPPRYWCKVVAATQGVVLTAAATGALPEPWLQAVLGAALALLAESFGREVWGLWCQHALVSTRSERVPRLARQLAGLSVRTARMRRAQAELGELRLSAPAARVRGAVGGLITVIACLLVWVVLVAPNEISALRPSAFLRIPLEGLLVVALVLVLPRGVGRTLAVLVGLVLGLLTIVKVLDMAFYETLGRTFNPVTDVNYFGPGMDFLSDEIGRGTAIAAVVAVVLAGVVVVVITPLAFLRLSSVAERHRAASVRVLTALGVAWALCAASGAQFDPGTPIASTSAAGLTYEHVSEMPAAIRDRGEFAKELGVDRFEDTPTDALLTGLRGKDVLVVFVESYGRVAVEESDLSAQIDRLLETGTHRLHAAGFASRSAFLTSPTFGAGSWLAHATLQSGLDVDNELRYADLLGSDRLTLSTAFKRAGWRTVGVVPANDRDWPEGEWFYDFDMLYDSRNLGYAGPEFSYASMPDQYTMSAFQRLELANPDRAPVMAEIDLVSSHNPWTPVPRMVGWRQVGDGTIFDDMPEQGLSPDEVWPDPEKVRRAYAQTIEYSLRTLISYVQTYGDKDLVLVVLGDHQPATIVSGSDAGHDVPITILAHDPDVMDRMSRWDWEAGMRPSQEAPTWPMEDFRDRFLTAYGPRH